MTLTPRQYVYLKNRTTKFVGYRGIGDNAYHFVCLVRNEGLEGLKYDINRPITKKQAITENLICAICKEPLINKVR